MDPADESYLRGWRQRGRMARSAAIAWQQVRLREAAQAARALIDECGATRVLLFGSLARGEATLRSDVDLWVEGMDEARYLDAIALVRAQIHRAEVDLVLAERASPTLRERVLRDGRIEKSNLSNRAV